jgi:uncharacterized DUF497 family protein
MGGKRLGLGELKPLEFEWDEDNKDKNWEKHKVDFRECEEIFFNKPVRFFPDPKHSKKERRLVAYGITNEGRRLTTVFTIRNKKIRVVSARDMSKKERRIYEQKEKT